ncbi:CHAD domain-containing protein [Bradyrhizobium sp.]|uniref:CYTH and CHAD domain-containing protein n=1 Tax=Bradyrhizobium sp. TaxID=376 RepID=UPI003C153984
MGSEIELKFQVSPQEMKRLSAARSLRPIGAKPTEAEKSLSVYFDTVDRRLGSKGISLRVRHKADERVQTIKTQTSGIPFSRGQWEHKIDGDQPDFRFMRGTPLAQLRTKKLRSALSPIFATQICRVTRPLNEDGSRIEMALDEGLVRAGRKTEPISEFELELKRGKVLDLFKLAKRIGSLVPAKLAFKSKSERGFDLLADAAVPSRVANEINLKPGMSTGKAFQVIGRSVLRHVVDNESAARKGDSEGVHQMRVGLRKLRAVISIFAELLHDAQTEQIKSEMISMTGELGSVRDLDVYIKSKIEPLRKQRPRKSGLWEFARDLAIRRRAAFKKMKHAINSPRYRSLILDILQWIEAGEWLKHSKMRACRPVHHFAAKSLAHQCKKVLRKQKGVAEFDSRQLHELRIRFKKLRYSCEFFGSLFDSRKLSHRRRRFNDCLTDLQDNLGALNDISVHQKMLAALAAEKTSARHPRRDFAAGIVSGREQGEIQAYRKTVSKAARKLSRMRPFWIR